MRTIFAKFNSKCAGCQSTIKKGSMIQYDANNKKAYCKHECKPEETQQEKDRRESESMSAYIDAQERAMFERY